MSEYLSTYGTLITQIVDEQEKGRLTNLQRSLKEKGYQISYPTLLAYKTGRVVPTYEVAKRLLDTIGYQISFEELSEILDYSREQTRELVSEEDKYFQISVRLNPRLILDDEEAGASILEKILSERAEEVFSDEATRKEFRAGKKKLGTYLMYLIKKDLKENY